MKTNQKIRSEPCKRTREALLEKVFMAGIVVVIIAIDLLAIIYSK